MSSVKKIYSVVVSSYNRLEYLKVTVPKIKSERHENEIILVDDCSDDGTIEWAEVSGLFNKIFTKKVREPYCLCTIRNAGISLASNDYIIFLDSDCLPADGYFDGHDYIFNMCDCCVSVGLTDYYSKNGSKLIFEDTRKGYFTGKEFCQMKWENSFGGNIAFPKIVFDKIGTFDESFNGNWGFEDLDLSYRATKYGFKLFAHISSVVKHLQHSVSSQFQCRELKGVNRNLLLKKHGDILNVDTKKVHIGIKKNGYSIVVCSKSQVRSLKKVVEKIKQLRPDSEIILSNGVLTDETVEWARKSGIFSKICVQSGSGLDTFNTIRNCGIESASNEFVVLLNADCLPEETYFVGHDILFNSFPDSVSVGITREYDSEGNVMICEDPRISLCYNDNFRKCGWELCSCSNVAFKKLLWSEIGKFDESSRSEDLEFSHRLSKRYIQFYVSKLSSVRRLGSVTHD